MTKRRPPRWFDHLESDEVQFVRRFLLASGSLKELAGVYGVSYPTLRARLDRLIAKVEALESEQRDGPLRETVRELVRTDRLDVKLARQILDAFNAEQEGS